MTKHLLGTTGWLEACQKGREKLAAMSGVSVEDRWYLSEGSKRTVFDSTEIHLAWRRYVISGGR